MAMTAADCLAHERVHLIDHPMVQHKLTLMRDAETGSKLFRELTKELALFEGYEATRDLPLQDIKITTPMCDMVSKEVSGKKIAIVPILRAGLGMVDGLLELVPAARVGHIGMYRDPETHEPHVYYCKLPDDIDQREVLIVDPMLATGGSALACVEHLRAAGVKSLRLCIILGAPQGVEAVLEADPDVEIFTCAIDEGLNDHAYIVPGLGDAGDRIYGTK